MNRILTLLIITIALFAFGCSQKDAQTKNEGYQVTDSRNVTLRFKQKPQRIISLFPSTDEVLLSLVDHSRILALSKWSRDLNFSNVSEEAKKIPLIAERSPEFILKHKPDLVITRPDMGQDVSAIKSMGDMGIPVYVFRGPTSIAEVRQYILDMGAVTGEREKAQQIVDEMDKELTDLEKRFTSMKLSRKKALVWTTRGIVGGKGTLTHDILLKAHLDDALDECKMVPKSVASREIVVKENPDIIIAVGLESSGSKMIDSILQDPALQNVKAVQTGKVILLPIRYTSCNSQYLVQGIKNLVSAVYNIN